MMSLPPGFTAIKNAGSAGASSNFIGVVMHFKQPYKSRGDDWTLEFTIQDEFLAGSIGEDSSITCRIFRRTEEMLPKIDAIGDLAMMRNIGIQRFNNKLWLISAIRLSTAVLFFQASKVPMPEFSTAYSEGGLSRLPYTGTLAARSPTPAEQMAIINLKATAVPFLPELRKYAAKKATEPTFKNKRALIQDITIHNYYDILGEVVKRFSADPSTIDLYITDYTTNQDLFFYEDPNEAEGAEAASARQWPGPFGQMTMAIRLWEPHSSFAHSNVHEGDIVFLQDVHAKLSQANKLEGGLHQDQRFPEKIKIRKVAYTRQIEEHKARKAAYERAYELRRANQILAQAPQHVPKKPSAKASAKKKEDKKEMQRLQKEQEQKELEKKAEEAAVARAGINTHVRASHPETPLSTIAEILHNSSLKTTTPKGTEIVLPFVNAKYRTRVRVVDFSPRNLEDFAHSMADPNWNMTLNNLTSKHRGGDNYFEWGFVLLVEDADVPAGTTPERLPLFVNNTAGQHLLKKNAVDLRKDSKRRTLKQLEEKMFILWGNLLELRNELNPKGVKFPLPSGDQRLQNMPFECCVEEYGVQCAKSDRWPQGWQRMHKLMGTTIMD